MSSADSNSSGPVVLVAADDDDILELVAFRLERAGYRILTATDGEQALQIGVCQRVGCRFQRRPKRREGNGAIWRGGRHAQSPSSEEMMRSASRSASAPSVSFASDCRARSTRSGRTLGDS